MNTTADTTILMGMLGNGETGRPQKADPGAMKEGGKWIR